MVVIKGFVYDFKGILSRRIWRGRMDGGFKEGTCCVNWM